jgi:hypothetical protein
MVQSFVSGTGFFVGGDENAFNAKYLNSASLIVSVRSLSRYAAADSFSRASNLSDYEPPQLALVVDTIDHFLTGELPRPSLSLVD